jgi:hypothetical protein
VVVSRLKPVLFSTLLAFFCIFLHELGHAAAAACCGAGIRDITFLSAIPRVTIAGSLTSLQTAWIAVAGSASEAALFLACALALPRNRTADLAVDVVGILAGIEITGWSITALGYRGEVSDNDAAQFLASTGITPGVVFAACSAFALILVLAYVLRVKTRPARRSPALTGKAAAS